MSAELDYAFLAQWARINNDGTLTAIDASFLRVIAALGTLFPLAVAGRVRFTGEPHAAELMIEFDGGGATMSYSATITADENTSYGDGRRHALFALTTQIPVVTEGDYRVNLRLDGDLVRELLFTVAAPPRE